MREGRPAAVTDQRSTACRHAIERAPAPFPLYETHGRPPCSRKAGRCATTAMLSRLAAAVRDGGGAATRRRNTFDAVVRGAREELRRRVAPGAAAHFSAKGGAAPPPQPKGPIAVEPVRSARVVTKSAPDDSCGSPLDGDDEEQGASAAPLVDPATGERGGPTRGGSRPEPTRYSDWEYKGRVSDF